MDINASGKIVLVTSDQTKDLRFQVWTSQVQTEERYARYACERVLRLNTVLGFPEVEDYARITEGGNTVVFCSRNKNSNACSLYINGKKVEGMPSNIAEILDCTLQGEAITFRYRATDGTEPVYQVNIGDTSSPVKSTTDSQRLATQVHMLGVMDLGF